MGEFDLIEKLAGRIRDRGRLVVGTGDDAAVAGPGGATATSVDAVVEGVHFSRAGWPLAAIGRKALAAALSDLAAMGAQAGEAYVTIGVPPDLDEEGCLAIHDGIVELAEETGTALGGGDVTRSDTLFLSVAVVGHAASGDDFVLRSGASEGDALVVTGELGGAGAGLLLLQREELADAVPPEEAEALRNRQLRAAPRLAAGRALAGAGATAMIDVSDGVFADSGLLGAASGLGVRIEAEGLPRAPGVAETAAAAGVDALELVGGGEDYELLAAIPRDRLDAATDAVRKTGTELTEIGTLEPGSGVTLQGPEGEIEPPPGHDHLG